MKWIRRSVALLLTCGVPALALVVVGQLMRGWNGVGVFALGLVLAPAGLLGGVLVGVPGFLWLDRSRRAGAWPGLALGALAGIVTLLAAVALLGVFAQPDLGEMSARDRVVVAAGLLVGGSVLGLVGALVFRGVDAVLAAGLLRDRS